jgi:hypothetical protein
MSDDMDTSHRLVQEHAWERIYHNNKGAFLILLAEVVATSMDAIVRFLQQGGRGIHPYQVYTLRFPQY